MHALALRGVQIADDLFWNRISRHLPETGLRQNIERGNAIALNRAFMDSSGMLSEK